MNKLLVEPSVFILFAFKLNHTKFFILLALLRRSV